MGFLVGSALPHQHKYIFTKKRFTALVSGLGAGKTRALLYRLLHFITNVPKATVCIYEPTIELIKRVIYPELTELLANSGVLYKLNKTDGLMEIWMPHGKCSIMFRSMNEPSRIIGYNTHLSLIDEIDTMPADKAKEVFDRIVSRNRKKFKYLDGTEGINQIGVTTTPEGFSFVYKTWVKEFGNDPDYELIRGRTTDNYHLPADYVDNMRKNFSPELVNAYINGQFVNLSGNTVYTSFDRVESHTDLTLKDFPASDVIHIGMDFNVNRGAAVAIMKGDGGMAYIVSEFKLVQDTPAMIELIKARFPNRIIVIFPDASGRSRKSIDASKSDIKLLREAGFRINAPKKNPPVRQRVVSLNTMLLNGEMERHLLVNTNTCPHLTEMFEKQIYDNNAVPTKLGDEDILDATGYAVDRLWGLSRSTTSVARMRFGS